MSNGNTDALDISAAAAALSVEDREGLVNDLKKTILELADKKLEILDDLTPNVRKRVEYLRELQSQHDELKTKFVEERIILEAKYEKLYEPLYAKRSGVLIGTIEVDGVTNEGKKDEDKEAEEKGVPSFWLIAMKNNEVLAEEITELDEEALKYLKDITWCKLEGAQGFKLTFSFDPNPFFKNTILTKAYHMINEEEDILEKAIGTPIEWLPGKCLTQKTLKKKPKKGSKNTKPITKIENCESFFHFFNPPQIPDDDDEDIDSDAVEELQDQLEQDYDVGSTILEDIIPRAVSWYTGEAASDDEFEVAVDDGEDNDEDDDDDEDDEDEEEEEEVDA
ncbi:nucleosome assembly protein 1;4-like [Impatiens glandulifera]|uniref:nucleosome assembly protein 1;4-like n=1 Tax=Impatiens glandulifera TaxID=253017 RepID=UPI001FB161C1|nr:nucleosome assembly protein 1;4-like [Impatiens glandulifera]